MKVIKLSDKELYRLLTGLIILMKHLDNHTNGTDVILSDHIEKISKNIELQASRQR